MFGQKRKKNEMLNLTAIVDSAARRHGWSHDRVKSAEDEYRKFLYLLMRFPKATLTPWCDDLDLFWHEHILHTERYADDCQRLFGCFINHNPSISNKPVGEINAKLTTAWAYYRTFGRRAGKEAPSWRLPTAASLAAIDNMIPAGAKPISSASRPGDGGTGHGCVGHGCGGGH